MYDFPRRRSSSIFWHRDGEGVFTATSQIRWPGCRLGAGLHALRHARARPAIADVEGF